MIPCNDDLLIIKIQRSVKFSFFSKARINLLEQPDFERDREHHNPVWKAFPRPPPTVHQTNPFLPSLLLIFEDVQNNQTFKLPALTFHDHSHIPYNSS